jgi:hypothetical protein
MLCDMGSSTLVIFFLLVIRSLPHRGATDVPVVGAGALGDT